MNTREEERDGRVGPAPHVSRRDAVEARLDAALEGTFPASDPVSIHVRSFEAPARRRRGTGGES